MTKRFVLNLSMVLGLVSCVLLSMVGFSDSCDDMQKNIVRIRIIANSDTDIDQTLKLSVRDAVLKETQKVFPSSASYNEIVRFVEENLNLFNKAAQDTIFENGYNYPVKAELKNEFFNTRHYDNFTLPAGDYKTLVITIGDGNGENWWCVIYPEVCVGSCSARLEDSVSEKSAHIAYNSDKYVVKFKTIEFFEKMKNMIK